MQHEALGSVGVGRERMDPALHEVQVQHSHRWAFDEQLDVVP